MWAVCVSNGGPCVSVRWLVEAVAVFTWMNGWMGWMDGWMDRWIDRHIY